MLDLALRDEVTQSDSDLMTLIDTIEALSATRTIAEVADVVRKAARRISGADGVAFVLRDNEQCWYFDEDAIGPLWKGKRFPLTACISGWAMLNRQTVVIPDIYLDDRIPHDAYRPTFVKSLVMTPVRLEDPGGRDRCLLGRRARARARDHQETAGDRPRHGLGPGERPAARQPGRRPSSRDLPAAGAGSSGEEHPGHRPVDLAPDPARPPRPRPSPRCSRTAFSRSPRLTSC
jgi:hypothetical protein